MELGTIKQNLLLLVKRIVRRLKNPSCFIEDLWKIWFIICAWYYQIIKTSGKVYRVPFGYDMWLPISWGASVVARAFGKWEPQTKRILEEYVKPGMTVVELGGCYGYFTILLSKLVEAEGKVYTFEPFPKYFAILKKNLIINNISNVSLFNKAASLKAGQLYFNSTDASPYLSLNQISGLDYSEHLKSAVERRETEEKEEVEVICLRNFVKQNKVEINFLFMDIEGCEIGVLRDMEQVIKEMKPLIFFELHKPFYKPDDSQFLDEFFKRCEYCTEVISRTHLFCVPRK